MTLMQLLDNSVIEANEWVADFMTELQINEIRLARKLLSGTLHALRDCLPYVEAEKLGARLPLVMREHFFRGWCPGSNGLTCAGPEEFCRRLRRYCNCQIPLEEELTLRAFCRMLERRFRHMAARISAAFFPGKK